MLRRKYEDDDLKTDRWLISYADFITLLLAFFVVMYSISSVNDGKYRVLSQAIMSAFQNPERSLQLIQQGNINRAEFPVEGDVLDPVGAELDGNTQFDLDGGVSEASEFQRLVALNQKLESNLDQLVANDLVNLKLTDDWLEISIKSGLLFKSGSDRLTESAVPLIESVSETLSGIPNELRVRGYTDNVPIDSEYFQDNWQLSSSRAIAVMNLMFANGISPYQTIAEGYGEFSPIADNNTREGRAKNRRVVIAVSKTGALTDDKVEELKKNEALTNIEIPPVEPEPQESILETEIKFELTRMEDGSLRIRAKEAQPPTGDDQQGNNQ